MLRLALAIVRAGKKDERCVETSRATQIREQLRRVHFQASETLVTENARPQRGLLTVGTVHKKYRSRLGFLDFRRHPSRFIPRWLKRNSKRDFPEPDPTHFRIILLSWEILNGANFSSDTEYGRIIVESQNLILQLFERAHDPNLGLALPPLAHRGSAARGRRARPKRDRSL